MYLIFDTETTGLPKRWKAPLTDSENWPRCIQIAWQIHDIKGALIRHEDYLISPDGFTIPFDSEKIHGISTVLAENQGTPLIEVLTKFQTALKEVEFVVGHNVSFDRNIMGAEYLRSGLEDVFEQKAVIDTCTEETARLCQIAGGRGGKFKLPTLSELYYFLFQERFKDAHNATADVEATTRVLFELLRKEFIHPKAFDNQDKQTQDLKAQPRFKSTGLRHQNLKKASEQLTKKESPLKTISISQADSSALSTASFVHLHNHSQFSVLQATSRVSQLVAATAEYKMPAVALTDHANLMGAFHFIKAINAHNKSLEKGKQTIKPIVGCEFYVCDDHTDKSRRDDGYQIVFLAKNKKGYHNLVKMTSIAYVNGFYYVPRIDRKVVQQYKEDLIVLTGNTYGEIASKILNLGDRQAEEALLWWHKEFKDDLYVELMRHNEEGEDRANTVLVRLANQYNLPLIATNNTYYTKKEEANAHDILLCVKEGEKQATPKGKGRGYRYGLPNEEYYFKSSDEMKNIFSDLPEAIINIQEIVDKVEIFTLARDVLLPAFDIPDEFKDTKDLEDKGKRGENNFLRHLTFVGAKKRYGEISESIKERLDFELSVIEKTGYPGYFLIVEDFIREARNMDVAVGPGRGSAAGSVVAFCLWITNIDPIKYDLLFERFLNPERISMPDIDIDFDDEGRGRVMEYVINKYGANQVAQIITYGTMAAKSSIRDTARVLDLPLFEADRIAKLIPNIKLKNIFSEDAKSKGKIASLRPEEKVMIEELRTISQGVGIESETINKATILEGSVRNTGIHACGVIITPSDITNYVPVALAKDSNMYVTQFDNSVVESAGLLKMDFLGLKTLTLIKDTVKIVKAKHNVELDPENFPLDDKKTYELFQKGETVGIFQYESPGMQKHMRSLKPTVFADLIAMNALYRPGPMEYIPSFINRKHGSEDIEYDLPAMEEYLAETYGITVYQEQVMLLSQKLANFTKGEADVLRKAMGKKQITVLDKMKPKFIEQASKNGHNSEKLEKIWKDWEAFASYAFNKSHSTCYAWIAYQTAYLKAHYPAEYMASVLSNNMSDIKSVSFFMEECRRMGLKVLGPDLNESYLKFSVNKEGAVRFGMAAVKGVGTSAVKAIIKERKKSGNYVSIFDLAKRVDLRAANKKSFDSLVKAGAFDSFSDTHRAQYFSTDDKGITFLERAMKFGSKYQENKNSSQVSMFGEASTVQFPEPDIPECEIWGTMELLSQEKEVIGIYISAHPLDDFKNEMIFCNAAIKHFKDDLSKYINMNLSFAGIISDVEHRVSKAGKGWALFTIEDYGDSNEFRIFGEEYLKMKHFLVPNSFLFVRATIQPGWTNKEGVKGEPRLKFIEMKLLHDIMDELCKKVTIKIPLDEVKENTILNLESILKNNPGKQSLNFTIWDAKEKLEVSLPSRNTKIKVTNELLSILEKQQINFKLN